MGRHLTTAASAVLALVVATTGCTGGDRGGDGDQPLPEAAALLASAAEEMAGLETVTLELTADTDVAGLPLRGVEGVVTRTGEAEGTARVEQLGQQLELQFVVVGDTFHYQLVGGWQQLPLADASEFYDPSAILDPDRGVANLLRTATEARVERRDGDTYEVTAAFDAAALESLLGVTEPVRGTVWIGVERPLLHRASVPVPGDGSEGGTVTVALSEFDRPVRISAP